MHHHNIRTLIGTIGVVTAIQVAAAATPVTESFCSTLSEGASQFVVDHRLDVLEQTQAKAPFSYKSASGAPTLAIMCRRSSPLPTPSDRKVVDAGYPLFIQTMKSITVLEKVDGQYRLRVLRGRLDPADQARIEPTLREMRR